jgi:hypothetical protein
MMSVVASYLLRTAATFVGFSIVGLACPMLLRAIVRLSKVFLGIVFGGFAWAVAAGIYTSLVTLEAFVGFLAGGVLLSVVYFSR